MGMISKMRAALGGKTIPREGTGLELPRWRMAPPRKNANALLHAYKEMPWLGLIVDTVGDGVADLCWKMCQTVETDSQGTKRAKRNGVIQRASFKHRSEKLKALRDVNALEDLPNHPLLDLIDDPNDFMTGREFWKLITAHVDVVGEAFIVVEDRGGVPVSLWPVTPDLVWHLPDLSLPKDQWTYTMMAGGKVFTVPAASVIALKRIDISDPLGRGVGIAYALGDELDTDEYMARFAKNNFYNNALPGAVIGIEGFSESNKANAQLFKESLAREYGGPNNAGRVLLTNGKTTIARLDTPFKDMQFIEGRKFFKDFVRQVYRVPPEVVADLASTNKGSFLGALELLARLCTVPRAEMIRAIVQKRLVPRFPGSEAAIFDYESPIPADRQLRLSVMTVMPAAFSYDEWRAEADYKPDPERQGYPMPLPGQKPEGNQAPTPAEGSVAEAHADATSEAEGKDD